MLEIGIKFCGNCNPTIDAHLLIEDIKRRLSGFNIFPSDKPGLDALLIISACTVDCATRPSQCPPVVISVAGETINNVPCAEASLAEAACKALM